MLMFAQAIKNFFYDEEGVTAIEYALIAALIAVAIIAAVTLVGTDIAAVFTNISDKLQAIPAAP
jgi:pilus assembly protein Flp/PilA